MLFCLAVWFLIWYSNTVESAQIILLVNDICISSHMKAIISASTPAGNSNLGIDPWIPDVIWLRDMMRVLDVSIATIASSL